MLRRKGEAPSCVFAGGTVARIPTSSISHTRFSTNVPGLWALASGALGSARPLSSVQCECRRWTAAPCVGAGAPQAACWEGVLAAARAGDSLTCIGGNPKTRLQRPVLSLTR